MREPPVNSSPPAPPGLPHALRIHRRQHDLALIPNTREILPGETIERSQQVASPQRRRQRVQIPPVLCIVDKHVVPATLRPQSFLIRKRRALPRERVKCHFTQTRSGKPNVVVPPVSLNKSIVRCPLAFLVLLKVKYPPQVLSAGAAGIEKQNQFGRTRRQ